MAQNPDISKYFNDNSTSSKSAQFFDKITAVDQRQQPRTGSDKTTAERNVDDVNLKSIGDKSDEPVVCKIFQSNSNNSSSKKETDPSSFFDMMGSVDNEMNHSFAGEDSNLQYSSFGLKESGDILSSFKPIDESFAKPRCATESERSRDAWIIPDPARKVLIKMVTLPGTYIPERDNLTMPGVILEEELKDTVYEAVHHYLGESEASKRKVLTASEVTQDDKGIRDLIQAGCYRAAVNLTKNLLTIYGQGAGRAGHLSKHTVHSIQLWFTRLALLVKLRSFSIAHVESEPFGDLDKPDMFFQFYPELYGGRRGTIVPFSLRLLIAQIPAYIEKHQVALTRLYGILAVIRKILSNLGKGLFEDGTQSEISADARDESVKLWTNRENRVLRAIVSCAVAFKDYSLAIEVLQSLIDKEKDPEQHKCLQSALGRILLELGDVVSAEKQFALSRVGSSSLGSRDLINSGLYFLAQNQFDEAYRLFEKAHQMDPKNITALNNMSVCFLYMGKLKQAVDVLEDAIQKYPHQALHESLLLNLCTLYEMQSSFYFQSKLRLLMLVSQNKGDGFNVGCLKLPDINMRK